MITNKFLESLNLNVKKPVQNCDQYLTSLFDDDLVKSFFDTSLKFRCFLLNAKVLDFLYLQKFDATKLEALETLLDEMSEKFMTNKFEFDSEINL